VFLFYRLTRSFGRWAFLAFSISSSHGCGVIDTDSPSRVVAGDDEATLSGLVRLIGKKNKRIPSPCAQTTMMINESSKKISCYKCLFHQSTRWLQPDRLSLNTLTVGFTIWSCRWKTSPEPAASKFFSLAHSSSCRRGPYTKLGD